MYLHNSELCKEQIYFVYNTVDSLSREPQSSHYNGMQLSIRFEHTLVKQHVTEHSNQSNVID